MRSGNEYDFTDCADRYRVMSYLGRCCVRRKRSIDRPFVRSVHILVQLQYSPPSRAFLSDNSVWNSHSKRSHSIAMNGRICPWPASVQQQREQAAVRQQLLRLPVERLAAGPCARNGRLQGVRGSCDWLEGCGEWLGRERAVWGGGWWSGGLRASARGQQPSAGDWAYR